MRYNLLYMIILLLYACTGRGKYDSELLRRKTGGAKQGILLSCTNCNCVIDALKTEKELLKDIELYGSRNCISVNDSLDIKEMSTMTLDSVFEENYNLILFKHDDDYRYKYRLIETGEAVKFRKIVIDFFDIKP